MLAGMMVEVVANGGSVGFMAPLEIEEALSFWDDALAAADIGERLVLGAWDGELLVGTVTLGLKLPPNQPHRADISKTMTRPSHRKRGVASSLMKEAERLATERGRTLLVLDTATVEGASGLYENLGYVLVGEIPDFALTPDGRLTGTKVYWKRLHQKPVRFPA
ncbi:MAG: GNAT family N-acetyltransferase [Rubrobacter sp.]